MKLKKNKILIVIIGFSLCIFILYLLSNYNTKSKEGFITLSPVAYSSTTITNYNNYIAQLKKDNTSSNTNFLTADDLQKLGVPEADVNTFISSGLWPWSQGFIDAIKKVELNTPNSDPTTVTSSLTEAQKQLPEQWYIAFFGQSYISQLNYIAKSKSLACNIDTSTNKAIGDGMYTLDASGNVTSTYIDNNQLPTLLPGFTFLNQPCNPCNIMNGIYDCPYSFPDADGKPLLPGFVMNYAWNTNSNSTVNDITTSISHLF
jgi:hypothetical protein